MASVPSNPTQLTPPRVALIDERSGAISREWYRFFLSLLNATESTQQEATLAPDATSLLASYDAMLETLTQTTETQPESASVSALAIAQSDIQSLALAPPGNSGSVTSVDASGGATGLTFSGGPITSSGTLTLGGTLAITNGGTGAITAAAARTNLGATTLGGNVFTITNPSAVTFPRFNADNTVSALDAATFRTAIGAGTGSGSVTSVSGAGTVNGITLTGTVTTSGSLTLGGTLSGVSLTTQVSGVLPIANGGTNGTATPTAGGVAYGTGTAYAVNSAGTSGQVLTSAGAGAPTWSTPTTGTVTSVTGTAPVVSSGGSTPAISMAAATTSVNGYLTSTDWTTFNNKGSGSVTSVSGTGTVNGITLTGTVTTSGSLTLGGTLSGVSLTTQVSGTLPVANGGTNASTFTAGSVVFAGASGTYTQNNASFFWDNTNARLGLGTSAPSKKLHVVGDAADTALFGNIGGAAATSIGGITLGSLNDTAARRAWGIKTESTNAGQLGIFCAASNSTGPFAGTEVVSINSSGNFGIGSTTPGAKLAVSSGAVGLIASFSDGIAQTLQISTGAGYASLLNPNAGAIAFRNSGNSAEFMRVTAAGLVGIGTAAPASALDVVGSITASAGIKPVYLIGSAVATVINWDGAQFYPGVDGTILLGFPTFRWNTVYATTGTINTSDGNEKQDINLLNDAEKNVAVRLKSLVRSFKFNDAVAAKGAAARLHFGLIAQDVASAFEAEGLDPQKYAMFCSDTWYEVDGKPSSDVNDPFTKETEGAVEKTRLGLRYDELIVFMISML